MSRAIMLNDTRALSLVGKNHKVRKGSALSLEGI